MLKVAVVSCQCLIVDPFRQGGRLFISEKARENKEFLEKVRENLCFLGKSQGNFCQEVRINPEGEERRRKGGNVT